MEDIKQELRQDNLQVKSNAIAKLTYVGTPHPIVLGSHLQSFVSVANARIRHFVGRI